MRRVTVFAISAMAVSAAACVSVAPALAGADEAQRDSFWGKQATVSKDSYLATHREYMKVDPRDAKADANAASGVDQADASNPYFNHAEGTMSGPEAVAQSSAGANSGYVATYHQYMQVEPRDQKVTPSTADSNDIYVYHSMGTMAHP